MKQLSEERTGLSVWWKEAGRRRLTRLSSGTLNRQAARSILPIAKVMAGHSKAEVVSAIKAAFDNKQLPDPADPPHFRLRQATDHTFPSDERLFHNRVREEWLTIRPAPALRF